LTAGANCLYVSLMRSKSKSRATTTSSSRVAKQTAPVKQAAASNAAARKTLASEAPRAEPARPTEARLIDMVFPGQTNHYGTLFGGQALALMDKAAFIAASRFSRRTMVTASSEKCDFHVPVRQGQLVEAIGNVVKTGRTSVHVAVDLYTEDLLTGARQLATRGRFVLVAVDEAGKPTRISALEVPVRA
jgi:uncharacterized protein (TIGR00369 family)